MPPKKFVLLFYFCLVGRERVRGRDRERERGWGLDRKKIERVIALVHFSVLK